MFPRGWARERPLVRRKRTRRKLNRRPTDYERTQEVAGRFRWVLVSQNIRGVRVGAEPPVGTGRFGHGDWVETDRCVADGSDLLILPEVFVLCAWQPSARRVPQPPLLRNDSVSSQTASILSSGVVPDQSCPVRRLRAAKETARRPAGPLA